MKKLCLILAAGARDTMRWAFGNIYYLLVLAPLVLGLSYLTASRVASNAATIERLSFAFAFAFAALVETCLILSGVSRAAAEIYNVRHPENYFDTLPVVPLTQLFAAFAKRCFRVLLLLGSAFIALRSLTESESLSGSTFLFSLALLVLLTASAQAFAALCWIHGNRRRKKLALFGAMIVIAFVAALGGALMLNVFDFPIPFLADQFHLLVSGGATLVAILLLVGVLHERWRVFDLEHAARLQSSQSFNLASLLTARLQSGSVRTQLARDLQLTLRFFSAGVYLALWLTALWASSLFILLATTDLIPRATVARSFFDLTWSPPVVATKIICVLATATLAALLPLLIAHELPSLWLERAAGATGKQLWSAKCWYARAVSFPAPFIIWAVGASTGALPALYIVPALLECLWLWWMVSTLMGALAFEMPTKPGLGLIVMLTLAVALGICVSLVWPVGLLLYVFGISQIAMRGQARAKYFILTGED